MFINLTPHVISIITTTGTTVTIPVSGIIARVSQSEVLLEVLDGIPITRQTFGEVVDLPAASCEAAGVYYIVSRMVASAAGGDRDDLLIPGPLIRGEDGQPVGCRGLSRL